MKPIQLAGSNILQKFDNVKPDLEWGPLIAKARTAPYFPLLLSSHSGQNQQSWKITPAILPFI